MQISSVTPQANALTQNQPISTKSNRSRKSNKDPGRAQVSFSNQTKGGQRDQQAFTAAIVKNAQLKTKKSPNSVGRDTAAGGPVQQQKLDPGTKSRERSSNSKQVTSKS